MSRSATLLPFRNRWSVAATLLVATTLNFLDRQILGILAAIAIHNETIVRTKRRMFTPKPTAFIQKV